ncbi:MAG: hypothetical protein P8N43_08440, partial [Alphaproteobacteria bacterium]|nr:hypothetical protein [Alphaproteobacteria bacterium]
MVTKKPSSSTSKTAAALLASSSGEKPPAPVAEKSPEAAAEKPPKEAVEKPSEAAAAKPDEKRLGDEKVMAPASSGSDVGSGGSRGGGAAGVPPDGRQPAYFGVGLGVVALVAALTVPMWGPRIYGGPLRAEIGSANDMLARVSKAVTELEAVVPELRAAVEASSTKFQEIESKIDRVKLPAFLLAAGELRRALRESRPFETELEVAITVAGEGTELDPHFAKVGGLAAVGVPTTRQLHRRFGEIARRMFLVSQVAPDANITSRALARLSA